MKVVLFILIFIFLGLLDLFLWMLGFRLMGEDPDTVYNPDEDIIGFYILLFIFWILGLPVAICYYIWYFSRRIMISLIEIIMTSKNKEE